MIIEIVTQREISAAEFWDWANNAIASINEIAENEMRAMARHPELRNIKLTTVCHEDFTKLLEKGEFSITDKLPWTEVTTRYRIVER